MDDAGGTASYRWAPEDIKKLTDMGCAEIDAEAGLRTTGGVVARAAEWLMGGGS